MATTPDRDRGPRRPVLATLVVVLGGLLWMTGTVTLWARGHLFDSTGFSATAYEAIESESVRRLVAGRIVDQLIAHGSAELITIRPLLESLVQGTLSTPAFREVYAGAVEETHRTLFTRDRDTIVLSLADAMIVITSLLEKLYPDIAARLPANLQSVLIEISERNFAIDLARVADDFSFLAFVLPIVALGTFVVTIWISNAPRWALERIGVALAVSAVVVVIALDIGHRLVVASVDDTVRAAAAGDVWNVFSAGLRLWMWRTGIAGVLLAGWAASTVTARDAAASVARLRDLLLKGPTTPGGRLLYAGLYIVAGAILITQPETVLRLAVKSIGLVAVYYGTRELLHAIRTGEAQLLVRHDWLARLPLGGQRPLAVVAGISTALIAGVVVLFRLGQPPERAHLPAATTIRRCNGHAALCDRRLPDVAFAATHNAMSAASEPGWYFASHDRGIPDQLAAGIRGLLVDTHYGIPVEQGVRTNFADRVDQAGLERSLGEPFVAAAKRLGERWTPPEETATQETYLCHGFCELGATELTPALTGIREFLDDNPHEVVIIFFEDYISPDDTAVAFKDSGLIDYVHTHEPGAPWPTLREMIERGERVLALSEKFGDEPRPPWYHAGFDLVQETPFRFHAPEEFSCRPNRGQPDSPLFQMNHWIEKITPSPADADTVNAYDVLLDRAQQCQRERRLLPNLVAVNFYARGGVLEVVDTLNGVGRRR